MGKMAYANGDVYNGQWLCGLQHGKGVTLFVDGREYRGQFQNGKKHGLGTFVFGSGRKWIGIFRMGRQYKKHKETFPEDDDEEVEAMAPPFTTNA
jgi:hypothetical protein